MKKKILENIVLVFILACVLFCLTACSSSDTEVKNNTTKENTTTNTSTNTEISTVTNTTNTVVTEEDTIDYVAAAEKQMSLPEKGETIAIIHVKNYGDIKVKFFNEVAPKAVENFVTHAKEGYYNGLTFHRIIDEFMIQGGDPLGNGTGGESIWGEGFGTELDKSLVPYRGSLCMAMSSAPNSIGSQFFITQANYNQSYYNYFKSWLMSNGLSTEVADLYKQYGGYLSLYMQYTVFGQVYEGMDVVDKIATSAKVEDDNGTVAKENQPIIESIEVSTYAE